MVGVLAFFFFFKSHKSSEECDCLVGLKFKTAGTGIEKQESGIFTMEVRRNDSVEDVRLLILILLPFSIQGHISTKTRASSQPNLH